MCEHGKVGGGAGGDGVEVCARGRWVLTGLYAMERPCARRRVYDSLGCRAPGPRETRMEEDDSKESKGRLRPMQISQ